MFEIIDFYADWCGPCKMMVPVVEEFEKIYKDKIKFSRVNVDMEGEKAAQYNVMSIPTFVLLKDGKPVDTRIGAMPKEIFKKWIDSHVK